MVKLRKRRTGSNLVDRGRDAVRDHPVGWSTPKPTGSVGGEAMMNDCGVVVAMLPEQSWAPPLSIGHAVNVGTTSGRPPGQAAGLVLGRSVADRGPWGGTEVS